MNERFFVALGDCFLKGLLQKFVIYSLQYSCGPFPYYFHLEALMAIVHDFVCN